MPRKSTGTKTNCVHCGVEFGYRPCAKRKYCSHKCYTDHKSVVDVASFWQKVNKHEFFSGKSSRASIARRHGMSITSVHRMLTRRTGKHIE